MECFAASGPGQLAVIERKMNSQVYQKILQKNMRMFVGQLELCRHWVMQKDNNPKRQCKSITEWLHKNEIRLLEWSSQSPDLNLVEML